jgi:hypothetical protein
VHSYLLVLLYRVHSYLLVVLYRVHSLSLLTLRSKIVSALSSCCPQVANPIFPTARLP